METGPWMTQAVMLRRDLLERCGPWHPGLLRNQDFEFNFRAAMLAKRLKFVDQTLSLRRAPEENTISKDCSEEAILSMIESVELVASHLKTAGVCPAGMNRFLCQKWIQVFRWAMQGRHKFLALHAASKARAFASPTIGAVMRACEVIISLAGCRPAFVFLEGVFSLKHMILGYRRQTYVES
jgi:hypothetical protein